MENGVFISTQHGLQGESIQVNDLQKQAYVQASENFSAYAIIDHDLVIVHDPEGMEIYNMVHELGKDLIDRCDLLLFSFESNIFVNLLQRISSVIVQKSLREGFVLTVTEAMWKGKAIVASNVGGIPLADHQSGNRFACGAPGLSRYSEAYS